MTRPWSMAGYGEVMAEQTNTPPPVLGTPGETCCGVNYPGNGGKPLGHRCELCPKASIYYGAEPGYQQRLQQRKSAKPGQYGG